MLQEGRLEISEGQRFARRLFYFRIEMDKSLDLIQKAILFDTARIVKMFLSLEP